MNERKRLRLPARMLLAITAIPGGILLLLQAYSVFNGSFSLQDAGLFTLLYALASVVLAFIAVRGRLF